MTIGKFMYFLEEVLNIPPNILFESYTALELDQYDKRWHYIKDDPDALVINRSNPLFVLKRLPRKGPLIERDPNLPNPILVEKQHRVIKKTEDMIVWSVKF